MSITPLVEVPHLAKALGLKNVIYLKREDLHPLGSHKGRSLPMMIEKYYKKGVVNFVISSSGNAALAAALWIKAYNQKNKPCCLNLQILVGRKINPKKLQTLIKLTDNNIHLKKITDPKRMAFQLNQEKRALWLRQSTDDTALIGYESLAQELAKIKKLQAIFIPTSSGTTAVGLYLGFQKIHRHPQIHIIQTTACHPFIKSDQKFKTNITSADAIVDIVGHRRKAIVNILKKNKGSATIATETQIKKAKKLLMQTEQIKISSNSALALVGLTQISHKKQLGAIVLLITGR